MRRLNKIFIISFLFSSCFAQTIKEKKESFQKSDKSGLDEATSKQLIAVNEELEGKRGLLKELYEKGRHFFTHGASEEDYKALVEAIAQCKKEINEIEVMWRKETCISEPYALWHQPEITISEFVADYGSQEYAYLIPPEIGTVSLSINSSLPIPRESWGECLELILNQYGVGIRQLNPYLRELYLFKNEISSLQCITSNSNDLDLLDAHDRICFVLPVDAADPKSTLHFLQKFSNPNTTAFEIIRGNIFIASTVDSIKELLKLYSFAKERTSSEDYQLISLAKVDAKEMMLILESAFGKNDKNQEETLKVIPLTSLSRTLFICGTKDETAKACKLIRDVEGQIEAPNAKTVFWYTTKHSDAEELATTLAKVYDLLIDHGTHKNDNKKRFIPEIKPVAAPENKEPSLVIHPPLINPLSSERSSHRTSDGQNNFIVDKKTGSIIMVVEQEALPKIKDLLKKLDVPKKMVQIEVLLFEKKATNQNKSGLNLLRLGANAGKEQNRGSWNDKGKGILEFLISHASKSSGIPSFDFAYQFLLGQEDVQINASPSVTTVNQTPCTIAVVEEISINTGSDFDKTKERNSYSRAQYGITIQITPTINVGGIEGEEEEEGYITLDTDITFDTTQKSTHEDRPDVTRRHIKNHVRIADGQTVILGGLRRKSTEDKKDSIPFLGEIPGLGKLFSTTDVYDSSTEMFVFITPKIISDATGEIQKMRTEELKKRPGDVPEYIQELLEAKAKEKRKLFQGGLTALFGKEDSTVNPSKGQKEYDGR